MTRRSPTPPTEPSPPSGRPWRWMLAARSPGRGLVLATLVGLAAAVGLQRVEPPGCPDDDAPPLVEPEPSPRRVAVRTHPASESQRTEVLALAHDVWSEHHGDTLDVVIDVADLRVLREHTIDFTELVSDVDAVAEVERERLAQPEAQRPVPPERWFDEYRDLETIHAYLDQLHQARPDLVEPQTLGASLQGRPLRAIRIHGDGQAPHRMLVNAGLHAREWISMMTATCIADRLVRGYDTDASLRRFVDEVELWVLPVANPDGYVHSWSRDRYWRKNRRGDHGVDLNRNFGLAWGGDGSSDNPASQVYRGTAPFSEPESVAIQTLMDTHRFDAHLDLHSYGQLLLHPWSHTRDKAPDHRGLQGLAKAMAAAIKAEHGERYRLISGARLYPASGTLLDWAYGTHGVASFVIELRPRGGTGFVLPPDQIVPTCDEGLAAVVALYERARTQESSPGEAPSGETPSAP